MPPPEVSYAAAVGRRLREVRLDLGLSLQAVEEASGREFRASALGAYERGERVISVPKLQRLAAIFGVRVEQLLPPVPGTPTRPATEAGQGEQGPLRIDLTRLDTLPSPERELLGRFVDLIRLQRQDFNGRVLTVRRDDVQALAALLDTAPGHMTDRLDELGIRQ